MKEFPRQTELTAQEILDMLNEKTPCHLPSCLLINELGSICCGNPGKNAAAEEHLVNLLNDEKPGYRAIAFSWLSLSPKLAEKYAKELATFEQDEKNSSLMPRIREQLAAMAE